MTGGIQHGIQRFFQRQLLPVERRQVHNAGSAGGHGEFAFVIVQTINIDAHAVDRTQIQRQRILSRRRARLGIRQLERQHIFAGMQSQLLHRPVVPLLATIRIHRPQLQPTGAVEIFVRLGSALFGQRHGQLQTQRIRVVARQIYAAVGAAAVHQLPAGFYNAAFLPIRQLAVVRFLRGGERREVHQRFFGGQLRSVIGFDDIGVRPNVDIQPIAAFQVADHLAERAGFVGEVGHIAVVVVVVGDDGGGKHIQRAALLDHAFVHAPREILHQIHGAALDIHEVGARIPRVRVV